MLTSKNSSTLHVNEHSRTQENKQAEPFSAWHWRIVQCVWVVLLLLFALDVAAQSSDAERVGVPQDSVNVKRDTRLGSYGTLPARDAARNSRERLGYTSSR